MSFAESAQVLKKMLNTHEKEYLGQMLLRENNVTMKGNADPPSLEGHILAEN